MRKLHSCAPIRWVERSFVRQNAFNGLLIATIHLQWNSKKKMIIVAKIFIRRLFVSLVSDFTSLGAPLERRLQCDNDKDFFDVQNFVT
jgi:hypothetical protein